MLLAEDSCARCAHAPDPGRLPSPCRWQSSKVPRTGQAGDVVAPAGQLLLLRGRHQALREQHHHFHARAGDGRRQPPRRRCRPKWPPECAAARSPARGMRARLAARKRAPKSLKAAVGPWNSSSTRRRPVVPSGFSGAGKLKASARSPASCAASASPFREDRMQRAAASDPAGQLRRRSMRGQSRGHCSRHIQAAIRRQALSAGPG